MRTIFGGTDIGLIRGSNQDGFVCGRVSDNMVYGVLCDGMGGENGGGIASDIAMGFAGAALERDLREDMNETSIKAVLDSAMAGANALVFEAAQSDSALTGMGTTMILAVLLGDRLYMTSVGDSRVYIVSKEKEQRLSRDHTVVQMLVDIGEITEEDARTHPKRHFITRAVGVAPTVEADFIAENVLDGEVVLICSDGLYNYLEQGRIYDIIGPCLAKGSADPAIAFANESGGADNITAIIMA
ncbi:MAG: protein phosphatase 2C domain-containing protein [Oscillospiraceae bacterium]|nr:protein phosphatase 2C domain-containing protein [Oscillospiraceae bacterium]